MRRILAYGLAASLIGALFLYLAVQQIDLATVQAYLATADAGAIVGSSLLFLLMYAICHGARIARWYELIQPIGEVSRGTAMRVAAVGFGAIVLLPLRLGEFVRPILLSRKTDIPMTAALGTAVVERVVDGLTITGLLFVTLATYDGTANTNGIRAVGLVSAAIFVPALGMCFLAWWRRSTATWLLNATIGRWVPKVSAKLEELLLTFIDGLKALTRANALARFLAFSLVYWAFNGLSMWVLARYGFGLQVGPWESMTMLSVLVVGIMIPAGPGMAGNFEFFLLQGLGMFVSLASAEVQGAVGAFAAALHLLQFVVILTPAFLVMIVDPQSRKLVQMTQLNQSEGR
ncbi:MAG: lysylphosphatidylglycerol synthase transmembrane domain-containing protein [bacterium]